MKAHVRLSLTIVCFQCALWFLGCGAEREELVSENVFLQLPENLHIRAEMLQNDCEGSIGLASGAEGKAFIEQDGNDFVWTQKASVQGGNSIALAGKICPLDDDEFELRLRTMSTLSVTNEGIACRVSMRVPSSYGRCQDIEDLCQDKTAVRLTWDVCTRSFWGRFPIGLSYAEACGGTASCQIEFRMSARLEVDSVKGCPQPVVPSPLCDFNSGCDCDT